MTSTKVAAEVCSFVGLRTNVDCRLPPAWMMAQERGSGKYVTPVCGTHRREMLKMWIPKSDFIRFPNSSEKKVIE